MRLKNILFLIGIIVFIFGFLYLTESRIQEYEKYECKTWKERSEIYPSWYAEEWQREQCKRYGIEFD